MDQISMGRLAYHSIAHIRIGNTCKVFSSVDPMGMGMLVYHFIDHISRSTVLRSGNTFIGYLLWIK